MNHILRTQLCRASFTRHYGCEIHPCCCLSLSHVQFSPLINLVGNSYNHALPHKKVEIKTSSYISPNFLASLKWPNALKPSSSSLYPEPLLSSLHAAAFGLGFLSLQNPIAAGCASVCAELLVFLRRIIFQTPFPELFLAKILFSTRGLWSPLFIFSFGSSFASPLDACLELPSTLFLPLPKQNHYLSWLSSDSSFFLHFHPAQSLSFPKRVPKSLPTLATFP